jgi:hypothetical protein
MAKVVVFEDKGFSQKGTPWARIKLDTGTWGSVFGGDVRLAREAYQAGSEVDVVVQTNERGTTIRFNGAQAKPQSSPAIQPTAQSRSQVVAADGGTPVAERIAGLEAEVFLRAVAVVAAAVAPGIEFGPASVERIMSFLKTGEWPAGFGSGPSGEALKEGVSFESL